MSNETFMKAAGRSWKKHKVKHPRAKWTTFLKKYSHDKSKGTKRSGPCKQRRNKVCASKTCTWRKSHKRKIAGKRAKIRVKGVCSRKGGKKKTSTKRKKKTDEYDYYASSGYYGGDVPYTPQPQAYTAPNGGLPYIPSTPKQNEGMFGLGFMGL
jgi:hypothetical protein